MRLMLLSLLLIRSSVIFGSHDTLYVCAPGEKIQLVADSGYAAYGWTPSRDLDNPGIYNPTATIFSNATFHMEAITSFSDNLIVNADFSDGNTGFISEYVYVPNSITTQGVYSISTNPSMLNDVFFSACTDHTDESGNMLVVDGFPAANVKVWCQTIAVSPETDYAFSTWVTSIFRENPAALQFSINGNNLGDIFRAGSTVCQWRQFYETWNSGQSTEAEICIINQNTDRQGNDFALDDFAFFEIGEIIRDTFSVFIDRPALTIIDTSICRGEQLEVAGNLYPADTSVVIPLQTLNGCDSIVQVTVAVLDTIFELLRVDTLCPGDVLDFRGNIIVQDTLICETFAISPSCDSSYCLQAVYLNETSIGAVVTPPSCEGLQDGAITLLPEAGIPPYQFRWQDESDLPGLFDLGSGTYRVSVTDSKSCLAEAEIAVEEPSPIVSLITSESEFCNGEINGKISLNAQGGFPPYRYILEDGSVYNTNQVVEGLASGIQVVTIRDIGDCEITTTINIAEPQPNELILPPVAFLQLGDSLPVRVRNAQNKTLSYQWSPEEGVQCPTCAKTFITPLRTTQYNVEAVDSNGCLLSGQWNVDVSRKSSLQHPNAFSPNGDGTNDRIQFFPGKGIKRLISLSIYDRWGNHLYERADCDVAQFDCSWDGFTYSQPAPPGIYLFTITVEYIDGVREIVGGDVLLIR